MADKAGREAVARATARMIRTSPRKLNDVAREIRGCAIDVADARLFGSRRRVARAVRKVLDSAVANAENNHGADVDRLVVAEAWVGKNLVMKRGIPRARGRYGRLLKPFSQITITLREADEG